MSETDRIEVVYDKECPICEFYCQRIDVRDSAGELVRVDARDDSEVMTEITALGLDIDEGMVVRIGDELHYGADAIHELAKLGSKKGFVNNAARLGFGSRRIARFLYPFFKFLRNLLLKMLGKTRINNLQQPDKDNF
jgi:predicted DCC family thiol-disulfide oxidoreductase YuxK